MKALSDQIDNQGLAVCSVSGDAFTPPPWQTQPLFFFHGDDHGK